MSLALKKKVLALASYTKSLITRLAASLGLGLELQLHYSASF